MQRARSRHLRELGTVSRNSRVFRGKFLSKNSCKLGLYPPNEERPRKCFWENQTHFAKPSQPSSMFLQWQELLPALDSQAARGAPTASTGSAGVSRVSLRTFLLAPPSLSDRLIGWGGLG